MDSVFFLDEGDWVILHPITRHGTNRIHQHGPHWLIKEMRNGRMLVQSANMTDKNGFNMRWVDLHDDRDFTWRKA